MVRLPDPRSANRLPTFSSHCFLSVSIDRLEETDTPLISDVQYTYCISSRSPTPCLTLRRPRGVYPLYNTLKVQNLPAGSTEPVQAELRIVCTILNAGSPAFSFLLTTNLSDSIFSNVLSARLRRSLASQGALHCPPHVTRS
jgi:hypothetical protein